MRQDARQKPTILVTGVTGQIGFELLRALQGLGRVVPCDRSMLDLADLDRVRAFVRDLKPALIVNPAAYTAVDKAESELELARRLNVDVPRVFAEEAARNDGTLIHYSTDYVFDGTKEGAYVETDSPNPLNAYGATKLEGEQAVAATGCAHLILRTSWVYGRRGRNFMLTMLKLAVDRPELRIVADQVGAPTWAATIAAATSHIVAQGLVSIDADWWTRRAGIYHLTSAGVTSWCGFAEAIFDIAMGSHAPTVVPISSADYPAATKRPANSRLALDKLGAVFGLQMPDWRCALELCLSE
ncbi:dTDP-4-dehydrorhamnose reductase [Burkholderia vietnamiensis]|uniref:dTDP-4-dehydrorhamnose reductase n=1 Tax=Burkholderia vietnamiensis TaxID=60552 RepID=UPI00075B0FF4|nr:dTDP-4-dehydrorhamnose reductase [Burkholderia vietnamiensis]KVF80192.1 dTDP-4-dehydrorhamnose reductase [Burkholderia vietnamiensis]KVF85345.1 dTDP-4-dehydrorhamnose reductase [Burkholderia vietnamiensis]KVF91846.1 dTDP-4-dehydrorhamnose reductase [Burkholderia vietnamiensis]KVG04590.1 dTDP-4-dehydrorhamnose reductase [Burkholderia vietnamiensis]MBR8083377.1 dTDP-4-dehydrorhamnose reductase [Burkholderia vietnamiensis]